MHKGFALGWVLSGDGNTVLFGDDELTALAAAAVQVVRFDLQLGSHPDWDDTILGHYNGVVNEMTSAGIDVIGLLGPGIVPGAKQGDWNVNAAEHNPTGGGDNPFLTRYAEKAQIVVSSLPAITHWEIWNEPNAWSRSNGTFFTGGSFIYPSLYATLLRRAHQGIKEMQPGSTIITGGLLGHTNNGVSVPSSGAEYLDHVYASLAHSGQHPTAPFDAIGQHYYIDQGRFLNSVELRQYLTFLKQVIARHEPGVARPVYITEAGWNTNAVTPDVQAQNLTALYRVCQEPGHADIAAVCWFALRDNEAAQPPLRFGVFTGDWTPKPSLQAFQGVA